MKARARSLSIAILAGSILWAGVGTAHAEYVAYAVTKKGEMPLPESLDDVKDAELISLKWGDYAGSTIRVAVLPVDNTSGAASYSVSGPNGQVYSYSADMGNQVPVNGIEAMVTDVLFRSGRFRLVERTEVNQVMGEQDLAASGRVAKPSGAKTGNILGAQYLIQGVVTSYEPDFKGKKGGLGGITKGFLGGAKLGKSQSMVGMNFRLIDAETSEVIFTKQVDVMMSSTEWGAGAIGWGSAGALGGFMSGYSKTPIGQAVMAAVNIGAYELVKQIGSAAPQGSVVKVDGDSVYVNLGEDVVSVGDKLTAFKKGEELIDPDTGISLGGEDTELGTLTVTSVQEKFSIAKAGFDASGLDRGDKIVSDKKPEALQFATAWEGKKK